VASFYGKFLSYVHHRLLEAGFVCSGCF